MIGSNKENVMKFYILLFLTIIYIPLKSQVETDPRLDGSQVSNRVRSAAEIYLENAEEYFEKQNYLQAIILYSRLIEGKSLEKCYLFYKRACCYFFIKNYRKSKLDIDNALKVGSKELDSDKIKSDSYLLLGQIYSQQNENEKALKTYKESLKYNKNSTLYSNIGFQLSKLKRYKKSLKAFKKAIKLNGLNAYAYSNRALSYQKLGKYDNARNDVMKSIELQPLNPYVYKNSALIYIAEGDFNSACIELDKAEKLDYEKFGNEADAAEIVNLKKENCR